MKAPLPQSDLHSAAQAIRSGQLDAATWMRECLQIAQSPLCNSVFRSFNPQALQQAQQAASQLPLAGLAVSVKDLFDIQGEVTTSGGNILAGQAPADSDALAVARLKAAGGVVIGRTHMVELAFSGVGVNPHFGTPNNPQALWADPAHPRIPGGSSSGAAVSVATGAAFIGLGSDTGGSLRIPAALCGLVGFKPTARSVPTDGAIELSRSLDTVGAITRSVRDAILAHEILSGRKLPGSFKPLHACRFAVAKTLMQDGLDESVATHFQRSLAQISAAGAQIIELELAEIQDLGSIQSRGGFAAPELMAWMVPAQLWPQRKGEIDPRVAVRVAMADSMSAVDYIRLQRARQTWIASIQNRLQGIDAMLSPTVPIVAPPIADVAPGPERDAEFFRVNALLLRNTSVVNMLDGCAISLPNHRLGEMPTGLMLWHHGAMDDAILHISREIEALLR